MASGTRTIWSRLPVVHQLRQSVGLQRGMLIAGLSLTGLFILIAVLAPLIAPYGFAQLKDANGQFGSQQPPSAAHIWGTTVGGYDVFSRVIWGAQTAILVIVLWQLATDIFEIKAYVLPSPVEIFEVYVHHFSLIWRNAKYTLWEAVLGFAIGCVAAWLFGMAMAASRPLERSFLPFVVGSTTIPIVAVAP